MNRLAHPALLMVDTVSSLASMDYRHDEWEVDVTACGSQKGLMVPPGLSFNAISEKAHRRGPPGEAAEAVLGLDRDDQAASERVLRVHPGDEPALRPARGAARCCRKKGCRRSSPATIATRRRHARPFGAWGLEIVCADPREYSSSLTAVFTPDGHSADGLRRTVLDQFDMSLGTGLGRLADRAFRIGHLGSFNDLMLAGTLAGVEMGLRVAGVPHPRGRRDGGASRARA